jgi:hypothetical protein
MSRRLVLENYWLLIRVDLLMRRRNLHAIHELVRNEPLVRNPRSKAVSGEEICHAMDLACAFYLKPVLCLQRSAATTLQLRRYGWNAEMMIGVRMVPFQSHAWIELDGKVVNDKPYMREIYSVMERC